MPGKYQVKFYGFTREDARAFCKDLARVLNKTEEEAWSFLMDAPLVVKDGLGKPQAQQLTEQLVSISALCLMEPMEGTEEEEELEAPPPVPEPAEKEPERVKGDIWRFRIWLAVVAVTGATLLIFGTVAYFVAYRDLYASKRSGASQSTEAETRTNLAESSPEATETRAELIERIAALEASLNESRAKAKELDHEINATAGKMGTDPYELRKKQQTLHRYRTDIVDAQRELRSLREKLADLEEER